MRTVHWVALVLVIIGAINWGLVGFFEFDLVAALFGGADTVASRIVYAIVGLAGLLLAFTSASLYASDGLTHTGTRMPTP